VTALAADEHDNSAENSILTTSAIPLPWPAGFRPETLRPPLSAEFALFGSYELFIGTLPENLKKSLRQPTGLPDLPASLVRVTAIGSGANSSEIAMVYSTRAAPCPPVPEGPGSQVVGCKFVTLLPTAIFFPLTSTPL
jgi:hypothetical protein